MPKTPRIYTNPNLPQVDIPNVDLLTLLFDSEHSIAQPDTVLHIDAAHPENKFTKADLQDTIQRIAHGLRNHYGVGANGPNKDVITVMSYGQIMVPAAFYGVVAAGGIYSAASPSSTVAELARQITIGKSNLVICSAEHKDVVSQAAKQCNVPASRVLILESWPEHFLKSLDGSINAISSQRLPWQRITDPAALKKSIITILWSSGTTGLPKGVSLSHLNLVAETYLLTFQPRMFVAKQLETDPDSYKPMEYKTLAHLPISHIAGLFGYLVAPFYNGGTVYWMRKYNWPDLLKYVKNYKITAFYTVPSIYLRISKSPDVTDHFAHVEAASTGAAPMDGKLQTASNSRLGDGRSTFIGQTWGLSETTGAVTAMPKGETDTTGSISPILPNVELRMVDDNYQDIEPGQEGELLIRSPLVMEGYFNNPEATRDAFYDFKDDGKGHWFCSGDIGVYRHGKFYIVDRKKELLKYKGLQIAPAEIENLLFTHPAVGEAAVVGVPAPDDPGTDLPRAYIVLAKDMAARKGESDTASGTQNYPSTPALSVQAAEQGVAARDSSKSDTLNQTRYTDTAAQRAANVTSHLTSANPAAESWPSSLALSATASEERSAVNDSSKQDTLGQTRYMDQKSSSSSTPTPSPQNSSKSDPSKQDTLSQTRYTDSSSPGSDSSKQDTLSQTRYIPKPSSSSSPSPGPDSFSALSEADLVEELKRYVADRLAPHKQLRGGVKFVSEIPKNAIGKFLRRELRERAKKEVKEERGVVEAKL
ncbi:hypothetical protein PMZ80_006515 [Knufia obscura]|uniref:Uncharacterized protein n=2 Tax=Knufia TaxID=430999 RepID=A0AAN8EAU2_9EURO|nr:hypothetical protein PMZ80_006515 [Knufia obscura]KAK5950874.1 hypothetical protein OHC33_007945 [Knufia fluminis]